LWFRHVLLTVIHASRKIKTEAGMDDGLRVVSMTAARATGTVVV
jgi:hypothetical protein